jgi:SAM-dependent methyltransferase
MAERLAPILDACAEGRLPPNIALMRLLIEAGSHEEAEAAIARARAGGSSHVDELSRLFAATPGAWTTIRAVMAEAEHDRFAGKDGVAHWSAVFDRLARFAPEAGVALYALGSPDLLAAATEEVVDRMREWGLLGLDRALLEIGCGIGRLALALAPEMASVAGLDVSGEMIAEARRRAAGMANARFTQSSGRDLSDIPDASVDVALAADMFPYLVAAAENLACIHVEEASRVLRPGGALLVLNYSYRGDLEADRRDVRALFDAAGLTTERDGTQDFTLWDASAYLGRKPS